MLTRKCPKCKLYLNFKDFYYNNIQKKFFTYCKKCKKELDKNYRKKKPKTPKLVIDKDYRKKARLKSVYNITEEEYDTQRNLQNDVCAICNNKCVTNNNLCVDHCHETGILRGLLCQRCNTALGKFLNNIQILYTAIEYLKNNGVWYCQKYKSLK